MSTLSLCYQTPQLAQRFDQIIEFEPLYDHLTQL
jgi:hypothetical protein